MKQIHPTDERESLPKSVSQITHHNNKGDLFGGIALVVATLAALLIANSGLGPQYDALIHATGEIRIGSVGLSMSLEHWINDGLMAIFFLLVGLEIKREAIEGSLASLQKAALPVMAAIGGFVVPALFYAALNWGSSEALRGWPSRRLPTSPLQSGFAHCSAAPFPHRSRCSCWRWPSSTT